MWCIPSRAALQQDMYSYLTTAFTRVGCYTQNSNALPFNMVEASNLTKFYSCCRDSMWYNVETLEHVTISDFFANSNSTSGAHSVTGAGFSVNTSVFTYQSPFHQCSLNQLLQPSKRTMKNKNKRKGRIEERKRKKNTHPSWQVIRWTLPLPLPLPRHPNPCNALLYFLNIYMFQLKHGCQFWSMGSDKILAPGWKQVEQTLL